METGGSGLDGFVSYCSMLGHTVLMLVFMSVKKNFRTWICKIKLKEKTCWGP